MKVENFLNDARHVMSSSESLAFFACIFIKLKLIKKEGFGTVGVNTTSMVVDPEFIKNHVNSEDDLKFLIAHEILHICFGHVLPSRRGNRDPKIWNYACDYVINYELTTITHRGAKVFKLMDNVLYDPKYADMTAEQVYDLLLQDSSNFPANAQTPQDICQEMPEEEGDDGTPNSGDDSKDGNSNEQLSEGKGGSPAQLSEEQMEQQIREYMLQGAMAQDLAQGGKNAGTSTLASGIRKAIEKYMNPTLNWKTILARFLTNCAKDDYSWKRPNRRFFPKFYLPSLYSEGLEQISFAIDVSASIQEEQFKLFISELNHVMKGFKPKSMQVIQFDTEVLANDEVRNVTELNNVEFISGGGTDVESTLNMFYRNTKSKALIIFTDGYLNTHLPRPNKPVIWAIYDNPEWKQPFGECFHFNLDSIK